MMKNKKWFRKLIIIFGWLFVWQLVSLFVGNRILLVGPMETLVTLVKLLPEVGFWSACLGTCLRILTGFLAGMLLGVLLAVASARYPLLEEILAPVMTLIKAVPVASFVVIFLIWWGSAQLATVISFCIVLPNLYINTLEGIKSTDEKLLEMARVFEIPMWNRTFYIYRPALKPFLDSAIKLAAGMSWKSGVAAEVIGLPAHAIGEQLYMSKIYLDTAGVLAWTVVTICLSTAFEKVVLCLWERFCLWEPACRAAKRFGADGEPEQWSAADSGAKLEQMDVAENGTEVVQLGFADGGAGRKQSCIAENGTEVRKSSLAEEMLKQDRRLGTTISEGKKSIVRLKEISKAYHENVVLDKVSAEYQSGKTYYFNSPSGSGKTTLFRLLAGLEKPDAGVLFLNVQSIAFLFQEDRLCEDYSALKNVELVTGDKEAAKRHLLQLLDEADLHKPCKELSGGQKRRVAIARTMAVHAPLILLDEPYNGLDEANRTRVREYIQKHSGESIVLLASHIE